MNDLNCNLGSPTLDHTCKSTLLYNNTNLFNLQQLIDEPTRITESSSTLLDVIFTNMPDKIVRSGDSHIGIIAWFKLSQTFYRCI